jgi:hypothetical protein
VEKFIGDAVMAAVQDEAQARGVVVNAPYDEAPSE